MNGAGAEIKIPELTAAKAEIRSIHAGLQDQITVAARSD
jgi:hypothetical protein